MLFRLITGLFLLFLTIQCTFFKKPTELNPKENLVFQITQLINDPALVNAHIGIYIQSLSDSTILFEQNKFRLFIPASNQKLFTTAVALDELSPEFRFMTQFYNSGDIQDSVLNGNLVIRGMGDPTISGRFYNSDVLKLFNDWGDSLIQKGISRINGDLIGDASYFSDSKLGKGWNWDDEPYYYSAQISALSFNENCVALAISAEGDSADSVTVSPIPETDYIILNNNAKIVDADSSSKLKIWRERAENIIELNGGLHQGEMDTILAAIENPALWFIKVFSDVLHSKGIDINGSLKTVGCRDSLLNNNMDTLFIHYSPILRDVLPVINKKSNNFYAEQVIRTLGAVIEKKGTAEAGVKVIKRWLENIGVKNEHAISVDGSGLSRMNLVSPFATAALLREMYTNENFQFFYESLPIAGIDGTLKNRMKGSIAEGVVRAKTGFLTRVRNLAGYTKDLSGNDYLFIIMVNNYSVETSYINKFQDRIVILLSNYNPDKS